MTHISAFYFSFANCNFGVGSGKRWPLYINAGAGGKESEVIIIITIDHLICYREQRGGESEQVREREMVKVMKNTERGGERRNKGAWTAEEDKKLVDYVRIHGDRRWRTLPAKAGLNRCGKSCRLRWLNYLRPGIKRGNISEDEEDMIIRLQNLLGNRWSLIAGRLPGRTDNEIKNHWNTHLSKKSLTIRDLNSKLHRMLESNHNGLSPSSISSALTSGFREEAPVCHAQPWVETTSHQMFDMDEILNLSFPPEFGDVASLDHCLGLSKIWFPSPQPMAPENFDFDDITRFMDYKDCFFYLP